MNRLFLIDAYALIFRFYYAFLSRPMRNREGVNTSAIFGFTKFLNDIISRERPDFLGVAFDPGGKTFRSDMFAEYKANRSETPEDIRASVPYIKRILAAMGIPVLQVEGYEADDVIGTLAIEAGNKGYEVYMVTPDKDYGQLVRDNVHIYKQRKSADGIEIVGVKEILEYYNITDPRQVIDILALWGDASDNIPGVPGIGEKSAIKLVSQFGSVENILADTSMLKGKQQENVEACTEQIVLAKRLATIALDVPIAFEPDKLTLDNPNCDALRDIYKELGFSMFLRDLDSICNDLHAIAEGEQVQRDLFGGVMVETKPIVKQEAMPVKTELSLFDQDAQPLYKTIDTQAHTYRIVSDELQLEAMLSDITRYKTVCFDTETTGLDTFNDRIIGVSFAVRENEAYYVALPPDNRVETDRILNKLRPIFEDKTVAKVGQNLKFDYMVLLNYGIRVEGFFHDTMIMHYLLAPESRHGMDYLSKIYLEYLPISIEELIGKGVSQITMDRVSVERVGIYSCEDADITLKLYNILRNEIVNQELEKLYREIEEPLIRTLGDMERNGIAIDVKALDAYGEVVGKRSEIIESEIREMAEEPALNINSARQLGEILFGKLKIDAKPKLTKTKQYSTDEEYLQSLTEKHPIIAKILEYRGLRKLLTTYITALPQMVNPATGRIHTSFNQATTSTGRLSSTNPNLQNIPIRDDSGKEIRKAFIPSGENFELFSADYSQVELRLMACLSGDKELLEAFHEGKDIHTATAAKIFKIAENEVTSEQRRRAKTANFGIIYGISAFGLAQRLTIPRGEAKAIIDGYFESYPAVREYMDEVIKQAKTQGFVTTMFGRKRVLPDINSANANVRGMSERNAINAPIQGSAADIIKIAMSRVGDEFREKQLKSELVLQVHDELVVNLYKPEYEVVKDIVVRNMEGAVSLAIPLIVECGAGANWLDAH